MLAAIKKPCQQVLNKKLLLLLYPKAFEKNYALHPAILS
jgi:hypothetical protein